MRNQSRLTAFVLAPFLLLATFVLIGLASGPRREAAASGRKHEPKVRDEVYVCACLQTKSCACMTEAKTEGPCACGTGGGPPMKAVARDSDWAKENRDALAK